MSRRSRTVFSNLSCLDEPFRSWEDFVAANFLLRRRALDGFCRRYHVELRAPGGARPQSCFRKSAPTPCMERPGCGGSRGKGGRCEPPCEHSLQRILAETLCWFGPDGEDIALWRARTGCGAIESCGHDFSPPAPSLSYPGHPSAEGWYWNHSATPLGDWDAVCYAQPGLLDPA